MLLVDINFMFSLFYFEAPGVLFNENKKENNMNMLDLGSPGLLVFRVYLFFSHMQIKRFLKPEVAIFQMSQISFLLSRTP